MRSAAGAALGLAAFTTACAPAPAPAGGRGAETGGVGRDCAEGFRRSGSPRLDLDRLGQACGERLGLRPTADPIVGEQREGEPSQRFRVRLEAGTCYRVFATGERQVRDLDLALYGADPELVVADASPDAYPVLPPAGLLCVDASGDYVLEVGVMAGHGRWAAQVWQE
ncbi:MAG: hypothetical protein IT376_15830 [Polyangiaceae bacterium]|nr:hypothetical protein [Polyangiaceae bacterium]